jgi:hypothetical protein
VVGDALGVALGELQHVGEDQAGQDEAEYELGPPAGGVLVDDGGQDTGDTQGKMAAPQPVLSTRLTFLKVGEDHSDFGTDSRANCSVNGMTGIRARMTAPRMRRRRRPRWPATGRHACPG